MIFTRAFWTAALERAAKTFAQAEAAALIAAGTGIINTDWPNTLSIAGMATVLSVLTSIGSDSLTDGTGPSLTNVETIAKPKPRKRPTKKTSTPPDPQA